MQMAVAKIQPCATSKEETQKQNFRNFKLHKKAQKPQIAVVAAAATASFQRNETKKKLKVT